MPDSPASISTPLSADFAAKSSANFRQSIPDNERKVLRWWSIYDPAFVQHDQQLVDLNTLFGCELETLKDRRARKVIPRDVSVEYAARYDMAWEEKLSIPPGTPPHEAKPGG
jgi:hypothetical protein